MFFSCPFLGHRLVTELMPRQVRVAMASRAHAYLSMSMRYFVFGSGN